MVAQIDVGDSGGYAELNATNYLYCRNINR